MNKKKKMKWNMEQKKKGMKIALERTKKDFYKNIRSDSTVIYKINIS
jgi:hypothetical protein